MHPIDPQLDHQIRRIIEHVRTLQRAYVPTVGRDNPDLAPALELAALALGRLVRAQERDEEPGVGDPPSIRVSARSLDGTTPAPPTSMSA